MTEPLQLPLRQHSRIRKLLLKKRRPKPIQKPS